ncbi:primosomal protein N' [Candidatus Falkowbacteria bacterium]|nr:primosomal protein N' [Candidatus Falkowbacteria bacterium]
MIIKVVPKIKLPLGANSVFDYRYDGDILVGQIVEVGFRSLTVEALVLEIRLSTTSTSSSSNENDKSETRRFKLKSITKVLSDEPMVSEREIEIMKWISEYYFVALSVVVRMFVPDVIKKSKKQPFDKLRAGKNKKTIIGTDAFKLTVMRSRLGEIKTAIDEVVGSDKNVLFVWNDFKEKVLVYIKLIEQSLSEGRQVMIILPQVVDIEFLQGFLKPRFGLKLVILHAGMGKIAQYTSWRRIQQNKAKIILGTRSAILAPIPNPGLIIIDEEESNDHKQYDMNPRYDVRRIVAKLDCKVVLSSSSPRIESYQKLNNAKLPFDAAQGRRKHMRNYHSASSSWPRGENTKELVKLVRPFERVELVDMINELSRGEYSPISSRMEEEMKSVLERERKVILFLNRKGMATMALCKDCQHLFKCSNCGMPMVYHEQTKEMVCHGCSQKEDIFLSCPKCSGENIKFVGTGTERIEKEVRKLFPNKKVIRIDKDAKYYKIDINKYDIIVGTQLLLKDFKKIDNVSLFGIVSLDIMMRRPDFRMSEKLYQLVSKILVWTRFNRAPKVLWQSYSFFASDERDEKNELVDLAARQDYPGLFEREINMREKLGYPPFLHLVKFIYKNFNQKNTQSEAQKLASNLRGLSFSGVQVIGPIEPFVNKVGPNYIINVVLKVKDLQILQKIPLQMLKGWLVDVEPEVL